MIKRIRCFITYMLNGVELAETVYNSDVDNSVSALRRKYGEIMIVSAFEY